jgi:hypothetical protein
MRKNLIAIVFILALASCKKEDNSIQPTGPTVLKHLTRISHSPASPTRVVDFTYDAQGRLVKQENFEDIDEEIVTGNTVVYRQTRKSEGNRITALVNGTLDANGRVTTASGTTEYIQGVPIQVQWNFEYNADGYLSKYTDTRNGNDIYVFAYTYLDGDVAEMAVTRNGVYQYGVQFEYGGIEDKIGLGQQYASGFTVAGLEGKTNKHLLKTYKSIASDHTIWNNENYTYTLDADGFPTKETITNSNNSPANVYDFTYNK